MDYPTAYKWFKQKPFQPFRLYVKDGRVYDVRYRYMNLINGAFAKIGIPDFSRHVPISHHTEFVWLKDIDRVEALADETSPTT